MQPTYVDRFARAYISAKYQSISKCKHTQKVDAKLSGSRESLLGISTFVGGNISVAIISVIRRLIVPDRSSIHERAAPVPYFIPYLGNGENLNGRGGRFA